MMSLAESMQKYLGWKEEEVFEELKALSIHSNDWKKLNSLKSLKVRNTKSQSSYLLNELNV